MGKFASPIEWKRTENTVIEAPLSIRAAAASRRPRRAARCSAVCRVSVPIELQSNSLAGQSSNQPAHCHPHTPPACHLLSVSHFTVCHPVTGTHSLHEIHGPIEPQILNQSTCHHHHSPITSKQANLTACNHNVTQVNQWMNQ